MIASLERRARSHLVVARRQGTRAIVVQDGLCRHAIEQQLAELGHVAAQRQW